jgi:protein O-GlcNAc transferase
LLASASPASFFVESRDSPDNDAQTGFCRSVASQATASRSRLAPSVRITLAFRWFSDNSDAVKISFQKAIEIALEQHQAGKFERAEALYLEILRQDPGNVDAIHLLGVLAHQGKQDESSVTLIKAAISKRPDAAIFHYNLADALCALERDDEAIAEYTRAVEIEPKYVQALSNLGNLLNNKHRFAEAEPYCRRATEIDPTGAVAWNNLGNSLRGINRFDESEKAYLKAITLQPTFAEAHNNLGLLLGRLGRLDEAAALFRNSLELHPANATIHINLGLVHVGLGRYEDAGDCFQTAIDIDPKNVDAHNNLGSTLRSLGRLGEACRLYRRVLELQPDFVEAQANLAGTLSDQGNKPDALKEIDAALLLRPDNASYHYLRGLILRDLQRHDEGEDAIRETLKIQPNNYAALTTLGYILQESGDLESAMEALQRSITLNPDPGTHSNVLMTINYHPDYSQADLFNAHRSWAELHEAPHVPNWKPHRNDRSPDRRLRIGYVSPDFRGHVVGYFLEPILRNHDHEKVEVFAYANLVQTDMQTWRMRATIDQWRETSSIPPDEVAAQIRDDQIDILVELAGHTGGNSLPVFARKPAPVQINMIGFPSTTGLSAIDYRITDERCDPPGLTDAFNSETLLRLPNLFWCYLPPADAPVIGSLPADTGNAFTFTAVNNFTKVTPYVQRMWAQLLSAVPNSRLILQTTALNSARTIKRVQQVFLAEGVEEGRVEFRKATGFGAYLQLLNESDITLDPFPFNGGTTTCHSLWMGAPVLTLAGDRHASRMGLSMMTAIGLPEFVAHTPEEYVQIGVHFANDLPRLREIRSGMRDRLRASPLLDGAGYTRNLEAAYRQVWKKWCATAPA